MTTPTPRTDRAFEGDLSVGLPPEIGNWDEAKEFCRFLESESAAHIKALRLCSIQCEHLHHAKADRHEIGEPCPVVARIQALIQTTKEMK